MSWSVSPHTSSIALAQQPRTQSRLEAAPGLRLGVVVVGASLATAVMLTTSPALNGYPAAAAYSIALLLASQYLAPRGVLLVGVLALASDLASNAVQRTALTIGVADSASLVAMVLLAFLVARQRGQ